MLTFSEFIKKYIDRYNDFDNVYGVQCVDLIDYYLKDVFNVSGVWVNSAKDFFNNFYQLPELSKYFTRITNVPELVSKWGDIVVWSGGKHGHIGIDVGGGSVSYFYTIEQNSGGNGECAKVLYHRYQDRHVLGVLRPKTNIGKQPIYRIIDKDGMNIRAGAGVNNKIVGFKPYSDTAFGLYTIVVGGQPWARLVGGGFMCVAKKFVEVK